MHKQARTQSPSRGYRDLLGWQRAMDLVVEAYRVSAVFPAEERYSLIEQVRRAAVSVPSNIAEGHGRDHLGDYLRQLSVANGSLMELETQVLIAGRMGYLRKEDEGRILRQTGEVGKMLSGLTRALKNRRIAGGWGRGRRARLGGRGGRGGGRPAAPRLRFRPRASSRSGSVPPCAVARRAPRRAREAARPAPRG